MVNLINKSEFFSDLLLLEEKELIIFNEGQIKLWALPLI